MSLCNTDVYGRTKSKIEIKGTPKPISDKKEKSTPVETCSTLILDTHGLKGHSYENNF
jgi:hypothetical protein